jgi:hypothetical protein
VWRSTEKKEGVRGAGGTETGEVGKKETATETGEVGKKETAFAVRTLRKTIWRT